MILFFLYPFVEAWAWYVVITRFGFWDGVLWSLTTALLGMLILRLQGVGALMDLQVSAAQGKIPARQIMHRLLIAIGAFLLILPGFVSDLTGFLLILPGTRHLIALWMVKRSATAVMSKMGNAGFVFRAGGFPGGASRGPMGDRRSSPRSTVEAERDVTPVSPYLDVKAQILEDSKIDRNS